MDVASTPTPNAGMKYTKQVRKFYLYLMAILHLLYLKILLQEFWIMIRYFNNCLELICRSIDSSGIVPRNFSKLASSESILMRMLNGTFLREKKVFFRGT